MRWFLEIAVQIGANRICVPTVGYFDKPYTCTSEVILSSFPVVLLHVPYISVQCEQEHDILGYL
jgi:hypothetical protein